MIRRVVSQAQLISDKAVCLVRCVSIVFDFDIQCPSLVSRKTVYPQGVMNERKEAIEGVYGANRPRWPILRAQRSLPRLLGPDYSVDHLRFLDQAIAKVWRKKATSFLAFPQIFQRFGESSPAREALLTVLTYHLMAFPIM